MTILWESIEYQQLTLVVFVVRILFLHQDDKLPEGQGDTYGSPLRAMYPP